MNAALAAGLNLFLTPGIVCHLSQPLGVTRANTVVLGLGFPTLHAGRRASTPMNGRGRGRRQDRRHPVRRRHDQQQRVADGRVRRSSDGEPRRRTRRRCRTCSSASAARSSGKATNSLVVNSNNVLVDDIWAWRADHGSRRRPAGRSTPPTPACWSTAPTCWRRASSSSTTSSTRCCGTARTARRSSSRTRCLTTCRARPPGPAPAASTAGRRTRSPPASRRTRGGASEATASSTSADQHEHQRGARLRGAGRDWRLAARHPHRVAGRQWHHQPHRQQHGGGGAGNRNEFREPRQLSLAVNRARPPTRNAPPPAASRSTCRRSRAIAGTVGRRGNRRCGSRASASGW